MVDASQVLRDIAQVLYAGNFQWVTSNRFDQIRTLAQQMYNQRHPGGIGWWDWHFGNTQVGQMMYRISIHRGGRTSQLVEDLREFIPYVEALARQQSSNITTFQQAYQAKLREREEIRQNQIINQQRFEQYEREWEEQDARQREVQFMFNNPRSSLMAIKQERNELEQFRISHSEQWDDMLEEQINTMFTEQDQERLDFYRNREQRAQYYILHGYWPEQDNDDEDDVQGRSFKKRRIIEEMSDDL